LEIADVLVVNKADLAGVENTERALRGSLDLAHPLPQHVRHHANQERVPGWDDKTELPELIWEPPILRTVAIDGTGIPGLVGAITAHRLHLDASGGWVLRERWRLQTELDMLLTSRLLEGFRSRLPAGVYEQALEDLLGRQLSPFQAVEKLVDMVV
jgi:LAO/AO transport system kinase